MTKEFPSFIGRVPECNLTLLDPAELSSRPGYEYVVRYVGLKDNNATKLVPLHDCKFDGRCRFGGKKVRASGNWRPALKFVKNLRRLVTKSGCQNELL